MTELTIVWIYVISVGLAFFCAGIALLINLFMYITDAGELDSLHFATILGSFIPLMNLWVIHYYLYRIFKGKYPNYN